MRNVLWDGSVLCGVTTSELSTLSTCPVHIFEINVQLAELKDVVGDSIKTPYFINVHLSYKVVRQKGFWLKIFRNDCLQIRHEIHALKMAQFFAGRQHDRAEEVFLQNSIEERFNKKCKVCLYVACARG